MKKAILIRFIGILTLALIVSSVIFYYFIGKRILSNDIANMIDTIHVVDYSIFYENDLQEELLKLHNLALGNLKRITIVDLQGTVLGETDADNIKDLENHIERREIQEAITNGEGYATRYSSTLKKSMLYVAVLSQNEKYVIRMAVPYTGILDYIVLIFPMLLLGTSVAFLVSVFISIRFTNTITLPLKEISKELKKINKNDFNFAFQKYRYEELNVISDSTVKLAKEVREHNEQIEFEKKVRQEFFSNASHELKTPITSIKGYAELLDQGFVKDEETKKDFMTRILKETDNMTGLINDILMISRLETKEAHVTFSMVRMGPLLEEIFESLEPIAVDYEVTMLKECQPIEIEASAKQLRELLMNLISNGIKYNHPGGFVKVMISEEEEDIVITVSDNGMGISEEDKERVFQRFYRVDRGRSKKMGGTGLGLAIVKHIVEYGKGTIHLNSKLGKGSIFTIRLPKKV